MTGFLTGHAGQLPCPERHEAEGSVFGRGFDGQCRGHGGLRIAGNCFDNRVCFLWADYARGKVENIFRQKKPRQMRGYGILRLDQRVTTLAYQLPSIKLPKSPEISSELGLSSNRTNGLAFPRLLLRHLSRISAMRAASVLDG